MYAAVVQSTHVLLALAEHLVPCNVCGGIYLVCFVPSLEEVESSIKAFVDGCHPNRVFGTDTNGDDHGEVRPAARYESQYTWSFRSKSVKGRQK